MQDDFIAFENNMNGIDRGYDIPDSVYAEIKRQIKEEVDSPINCFIETC